jgi:SAM-dependent methyltransferase
MSKTEYTAMGISMVKNEADVIEAFVRHNLAYVDLLVVVDNDSVDGTREILIALQAEGLPIVVFDDPIAGYFQSEKLTYLYRKIAPEFRPKFVYFLDADEFIVAQSRASLEAQLNQLPAGAQAHYPWRTYIPGPNAEALRDPLRDITYRRRMEEPVYYKAVFVRLPLLDSDLIVDQGCHNLRLSSGRELPMHPLQEAFIAHFPVRSLDQIQAKAIIGWFAYLLKNRNSAIQGQGFQWERLYHKSLSGHGLRAEDLVDEALGYAQIPASIRTWPDDVVSDPVVPQYSALMLTELGSASALQKVARSIERMLVPHPRYSFVPTRNPGALGESNSAGTSATTSFKASWHKENFFLDLPPFRHFAERYAPKSVLDLGCGLGGYLSFFGSMGAEKTIGVDGFPASMEFLANGEYRCHDLGQPLDLGETYDLVLCMEVIEHLTPEHEDVLIESILRHARERIIFSAAEVGQPGVGHINCRPIGYWLQKFERKGWAPDVLDSLAMRSLATFSWFKRNTVVLVRSVVNSELARLALVERAKDPVAWPDQKAEVVTHPFIDLLRAG